jgi:hypothetical protein
VILEASSWPSPNSGSILLTLPAELEILRMWFSSSEWSMCENTKSHGGKCPKIRWMCPPGRLELMDALSDPPHWLCVANLISSGNSSGPKNLVIFGTMWIVISIPVAMAKGRYGVNCSSEIREKRMARIETIESPARAHAAFLSAISNRQLERSWSKFTEGVRPCSTI